MKRVAAIVFAAAIVVALGAGNAPAARADTAPCPSPSPTATDARTCSTQSQYDELQQRLGGDLAKALKTQRYLSSTVAAASARAQLLAAELQQEEAKVAQLQDEVAQLDQQIAGLQLQIDTERAQVEALARAMYRQPSSFLDVIASSGNLAQALASTADLLVAGQRAHALQEKLKQDLDQAQADRAARQSDLDQENATLAQVQSGADQLTSIQQQLDSLTAQMVALIAQIQATVSSLTNVAPDVTASLATLMEQQEQQLDQEAQAVAWAEAGVGAGIAQNLMELPAGFGPTGILMAWPMLGTLTQPFGPTTFKLEPPLGQYPHFHTGIDIAAAYGSPVAAAADGLVVAVDHTAVGYGNYVIIAHGSGLFTLYAHLAQTSVVDGQRVVRGQVIGLEGDSGLATGPHVHFEVRYEGAVIDPMRYLPPR